MEVGRYLSRTSPPKVGTPRTREPSMVFGCFWTRDRLTVSLPIQSNCTVDST